MVVYVVFMNLQHLPVVHIPYHIMEECGIQEGSTVKGFSYAYKRKFYEVEIT